MSQSKQFTIITLVAGTALMGCAPQTDPSIDEQSLEIIERLESPRALSDEAYAKALDADIEALSDEEEIALVEAVAALYPAPTVDFRASANIPVRWDWSPDGAFPDVVGVTTACGGDVDVRVVFYKITNAYAKPNDLRLETNSVYVWAMMAIHGMTAYAYDITPQDNVNLCIDTGGVVTTFVRARFANGLRIS